MACSKPAPPPPAPEPLSGAAIYAARCASCHGEKAQGGSAPALDRWTRGAGPMTHIVSARMPPAEPGSCGGDCASKVVEYILGQLQQPPLSCAGGEKPSIPQRLRLLSRREYARTLRDLLPLDGASCAADDGCDVVRESCVAGTCEPDPCETRTFVWRPTDGRPRRSVHVAGTFNRWAATVAAGGWPMTWSARTGAYHLKHALANGQYQYKFVVDESQWLTDLANPARAPDGFGGDNSVLDQTCLAGAPAAAAFDPSSAFPPETRPSGFPFDDHAATGIVTSTLVERQLDAARDVAAKAMRRADRFVPCPLTSGDAACARAFVDALGPRAFRRPLAEDERTRLTSLVTSAPDFVQGITLALEVMLASPSFLYRSEFGEPQPDGTFTLSAWERASALSYALWGTMPDDALFDAARAGALATPEGMETQARRLLQSPRARETTGTFATQWLGVERVLSDDKNATSYPEFDAVLRRSLVAETQHFVADVVFDSTHRFPELFTSGHTFANAATGRLYGLQAASGAEPAKVPSSPERAAGILGHASVLAAYAHSDQSSPIRRGVFVRERLLCQAPGTPPPNAGGVPAVDPNATTRERFRQHTSRADCRACHQYIDPVGFGFERFDAIGRYRTTENGQPIDASGDMNDLEGLGTNTSAPFDTLPTLGQALAKSHAARACLVRQGFRYALGTLDGPLDACALDRIEARLATHDDDLREWLVALVTDPAFVRRASTTETP